MELYPHSSVTKWGDRTEDSSKHILHISLPKWKVNQQVRNWLTEASTYACTFKVRFYEHTQDFNHQSRDGTSLSHYVWKLKDNNTPYRISWQIITRSPSVNPTNKSCSLCLKEKYCSMFRPEGATLNDRSEFYATCRHKLKPLCLDRRGQH